MAILKPFRETSWPENIITNSEIKTKDCVCNDWKTENNKINSFIVLGNAHQMIYNGKKFLFCPWCGQDLKV